MISESASRLLLGVEMLKGVTTLFEKLIESLPVDETVICETLNGSGM